MKVLVINCGSSTVKFQVIDMESDNLLAKGRCERIGLDDSRLVYKDLKNNVNIDKVLSMPTHKEAMRYVLDTIQDKNHPVISALDEISAVGHRVVHGGEKFIKATLVTPEVINDIDELSELAPLHNPGALMGIKAIMDVEPKLPNVVVFDTAFHQTIPSFNYMYAIDYKYYEKYKIRKYGFHGTSYKYILERLKEILNKDKKDINAIICHLGGGASVCAIKDGKSYDTSMGYTPTEGLVMDTRCGDMDVTVPLSIMEKENLSLAQIRDILDKKAGRLGLCGYPDERDVLSTALDGNKKSNLTLNLENNRIKKYIGSYAFELGRVDAIVFTGGIGENNFFEREIILNGLDEFGIIFDPKANKDARGIEGCITTENSKIKAYVIPTNEELEIAKQTLKVVEKC